EGLDDTRERRLLQLEITLQLASALGSVRGYAAAETGEQLRRARTLCIALGQRTRRFNVEFGLCISGLVKGDLTAAAAHAAGMGAHAERGGKAELVDSCLAKGMIQTQMGRFAEARKEIEAAVALSDPRSDAPHLRTHALNPGIYSRLYLAHVLSFLGDCDAAL